MATGAATALLLLAAAATPADLAAVERLRPQYDTIRTRNSLQADVMLYAPTVEAVAGPAIVYFSGNWGWRPIMQDTASHLAANGRFVLGVDSMKYFGKLLDAGEWKHDLTTFRSYVNEKAGKPPDAPVILIGFTYGAEMIPYMLNRGGIEGIAGALLIGPGATGSVLCRLHLQLDLEIPEEERFDVGRELAALPSLPIVLLEGTLDEESKARDLLPLVKTPRRYAPIVGGDRQFTETRDVYFEYTAQAIDWIDSTARSPEEAAPADPGAEAPADGREPASGDPADDAAPGAGSAADR
ncbi:MAG TPA: AcvB/VirJ family lysyl-phosphatidylglycerol hydrolase [Candidatus Polarisedimenticolia bacterium]|nr:AcvB/VirJ family lysyl-phosphatidylglycerol hydrolase [Candidatus Polarisedimenticolia bacterium]